MSRKRLVTLSFTLTLSLILWSLWPQCRCHCHDTIPVLWYKIKCKACWKEGTQQSQRGQAGDPEGRQGTLAHNCIWLKAIYFVKYSKSKDHADASSSTCCAIHFYVNSFFVNLGVLMPQSHFRCCGLAGCPVSSWLVHSVPLQVFDPTISSLANQSHACNHRKAGYLCRTTSILWGDCTPCQYASYQCTDHVSKQNYFCAAKGSMFVMLFSFYLPTFICSVTLMLEVSGFTGAASVFWFHRISIEGFLSRFDNLFSEIAVVLLKSLFCLFYWVNSTIWSLLVVVLPRSFVFRTIKPILLL